MASRATRRHQRRTAAFIALAPPTSSCDCTPQGADEGGVTLTRDTVSTIEDEVAIVPPQYPVRAPWLDVGDDGDGEA